MKYLFLMLAGAIFMNSLKAYHAVGQSTFGGRLGGLIAVVVFLLVQGFELKPIFLTNGGAGIFPTLNKLVGGKVPTFALADPEELLDATLWATLGYAMDFIAGLLVWPPVSSYKLVAMGGVTFADIRWAAVGSILACVFGMQLCIQQYLSRGGKVPGILGGGHGKARAK
jgi:hypothetical protein